MTAEETLAKALARVTRTDPAHETTAWERLDSLTKPPRSLGRLEEMAARVARVQRTTHPDVARKAIVLAAGDHGVVAEGVSPFPQDVTWQMVANFVAGGAAINQLAASVGAQLVLVDVGVARDITHLDGVRHEKVAPGTRNMALGPAMTREEAAASMLVGIRIAEELAEEGVTLIGTGEMGIGNTTAASALVAAFAGADPDTVVGPGTGLDAEGVRHKADVVRRALRANDDAVTAAAEDPLALLAAVGGLEIACLAGVVIGAAAAGVCVLSDGFISGAATLAATRICPAAADYAFPSHRSSEPGHVATLAALDLTPVLDLDMRLGEGTGAALAMGLVDAACRMMSGMATFAEAGVSESGESDHPAEETRA